MHCIFLAHGSDRLKAVMNMVMGRMFTYMRRISDCLRTCYLLKMHFAPCSCLVRCSCIDIAYVGTDTQLGENNILQYLGAQFSM